MLTESKFYRDFESHHPPLAGYVLGDSACPPRDWLMTPVINTNNDAAKERYSKSHVPTHQTIERCNGVLKRRFHCLKAVLRVSPSRAVTIIMACIVLHNMAVFYKLPDPEDDQKDNNDGQELFRGNQITSAQDNRSHPVPALYPHRPSPRATPDGHPNRRGLSDRGVCIDVYARYRPLY